MTLVLIPLLTLTASQLAKLNAAVQRFDTVNAVHLGETTPDNVAGEVVPKLDVIEHGSSGTLMLLCSPQHLVPNKVLRDVLILCRDRRTLRLVSLDEAYLLAMHGATFRDLICFLRDDLFAILSLDQDGYAPLLLAMTATMPASLLKPFSDMIHVDFSLSCHQMWASAVAFQQQNIKMSLSTMGFSDMKQIELRKIID